VRVEPTERYGEGVAVGMEIEEGERLYTVTDVAAGKVVLDGNHPFAGMALRFSCEVVSVRAARREEVERGVLLP
jgi:FKBP-type peptidyl-prolyl cis-trans isomerase SlyD